MDAKAKKVLESLQRRTTRTTDLDLTRSTHLSLGVVRRRLKALIEAGVAEEYWIYQSGAYPDLGPFYRASPSP
jgi:DNA-binding Lrp family transcriptional regulator